MLARRRLASRRGATVLEMALVSQVFFLIIFGFISLGLGIFRYNQVCYLAREGARYACVRGRDYFRETGQPVATAATVHQEIVSRSATILDPTKLTTMVAWDQSNIPVRVDSSGAEFTNYVIVTVTYQWVPETLFTSTFTLSSTARVPMSY